MFCCITKQPRKKGPTQIIISHESFDDSINQENDNNQLATPPQLPKKLLVNNVNQPKLLGQTTKSESKLKDSKLVQPIRTISTRGLNPFKQFDCYQLVEITKNTEFLAAKECYTLLINKLKTD